VDLPQKVRLSPEVIVAAGIKTTVVTKQRLVPTRTLSGELTVDPDRSAKIASPVAGRLEEVRLREGATVKKGEVVALVRVPELGRLHGLQLAAMARAKAARADAHRLEDLARSSLATEQTYLDAKAEAEAQEAEAQALAGQLRSMGSGPGGATPFLLALRSPVAGIVVTREAIVGQPVAADQVLGMVADLSELWFLARLFEKDLEQVHEGAAVEVRLNAYPTTRFPGTVDLVGHQIDPVARTVTARVRLKNHDDLLRAGLFGSALVAVARAATTGAEAAPVLVVPRDAVTELAGKQVVFVRQDDGHFEVHPVVLGESAPGVVAIVSGLREGEAVVSEGTFSIKSVVLKSTLAEDD
jgi:membrane fusion protein, heavy metal efflux system